MRYFFAHLYEKKQLIGNFVIISATNFFKKLRKIHYFSQWRTQETISGGGAQCRGSGLVGSCLGFENLQKFIEDNCKNAAFSPILKKNFKPCGKFSRARTKNTIVLAILRKFWQFLMKNQLKNCVFIDFLGNIVSKNQNFAKNIIFLQQFFPVRGC